MIISWLLIMWGSDRDGRLPWLCLAVFSLPYSHAGALSLDHHRWTDSMQLGQFSASVSVDDVDLSEYAVDYSADGTQATCWIPSQNDKQFCLNFKNMDARPDYLVSCPTYVDGISCGGRYLRSTGPHISTGIRDSVSTSADARRPLTFSTQALTDDDAYLNASISPDLGTIRVVFTNVTPPVLEGHTRWDLGQYEPKILHERAKKSIGHSVQFGPEFRTGSRNRLCRDRTIKELVTFVFKYRPIGLLRAEGIAPPAPREEMSAPAAPADIVDLSMDVDDNDADADTKNENAAEIKKLEARLLMLKNKGKRVRREPAQVKKEIKSAKPIFKPGEVIDLT
ncbi:hypothetical protein DFH09DRAFT_252825 [Mycena vulgaris]|nr:hypothetical protein DFH09DRAFT_252825 [Mycena vulgaris]